MGTDRPVPYQLTPAADALLDARDGDAALRARMLVRVRVFVAAIVCTDAELDALLAWASATPEHVPEGDALDRWIAEALAGVRS